MSYGKIVVGLPTIVSVFVAGCAGGAASSEATPGAEQDLTSAQCPAKIEVQLDTPRISTDDEILHKLESPSQGESPTEAAEQLKEIAPHLKLAREDEPVTLSGSLMQACSYKTTRSPSGENAYGMHFSKSSGGSFSLRIEQLMDNPNQLFINVPLTNVSPTAIVADPSATGFISAEDTSNDHDGSGGFSVFIGTVKVTVKIVH
jgi:hypothetical protein